MRGWRNRAGNLIKIVWLKHTLSQASIYWCLREKEGHGFIEFEMSNSAVFTVFRQPLHEAAAESSSLQVPARTEAEYVKVLPGGSALNQAGRETTYDII